MSSKKVYQTTWQQYKNEMPFAIAILGVMAIILAIIIHFGNKDYEQHFKPHEKYLTESIGEIFEKEKAGRKRGWWIIRYFYEVENQKFRCSFDTYEPDTIQIGDKCKIWFSTNDNRFHKVNNLQNEVEKAKAISSEN